MSVELEWETESERVTELLGARDLIRECEEMLRGERQEFTGMDEYLQQRLAFWQGRYSELDLRRAERRHGERRIKGRAVAGRRVLADRRKAS